MASVPEGALATWGSNMPTGTFSTGWFVVSAMRWIETNYKGPGERTLLARYEDELCEGVGFI